MQRVYVPYLIPHQLSQHRQWVVNFERPWLAKAMAPEKSTPSAGGQLKNAFPFSSGGYAGPTSINLQGPRAGPPPPVPPRPSQNYTGYNEYRPYYSGNYYNGYNQYRNYSGYGSYGSYGSYSTPYSPYSSYPSYGPGGAPSGDVESRFFRNAEEGTRATFRMVETIVQTFSSLTMLLESTYFAIMNSFRAILNVAENIARLRSTVSQLFSTFALIRLIKWLYRKVMCIRGPVSAELSNDDLWKKCAGVNEGTPGSPSMTWSGLLMFSIFIVIPYLIHKISNNIKNIQTKGNDPEQWNKLDEPVYTATVLYDFAAGSEEELNVKAGQKIWLAPQSLQPTNSSGWYKATDHRTVGLVPANYIQIVGQLVKKTKPQALEGPRTTLNRPGTSFDTPGQSFDDYKQPEGPMQSLGGPKLAAEGPRQPFDVPKGTSEVGQSFESPRQLSGSQILSSEDSKQSFEPFAQPTEDPVGSNGFSEEQNENGELNKESTDS